MRNVLNPLLNNKPQYLGTASVSFVVEKDSIHEVPQHVGIIVSGYGYVRTDTGVEIDIETEISELDTSICCRGKSKVLASGFPDILGQTQNNNQSKVWAIGFDLVPSGIQKWTYMQIMGKIFGGQKVNSLGVTYHTEIEFTVPVLYEDAETLIKRGNESENAHYDVVRFNCGSFANMLMRKANIPVPRFSSYCNMLCIPCPNPCGLPAAIGKAKVGSEKYRKKSKVIKRKPADVLTNQQQTAQIILNM
jgi:hypothetical protein